MSDDYFEWAAARYHDHKLARAAVNPGTTKAPAKPANAREANGARTLRPGRKLGELHR